MSIIEFQKALQKEIEKILKDVITKDPDGKQCVGVSVYRQYLPKVEEDDEDITKYFPYAIVRIMDGLTEDDYNAWLVTVNILLGAYDEGPDMAGDDHIMIMIQRIINRFSQEARIAPNYTCERSMDWALQDEDTYPYYFGGVQLKFRVPKMGRSIPKYE